MVDDTTDRISAIYAAICSHELELNRATATFEHAVVAPLTLLNGGAAAAWLSFIATRDSPPSAAPVACWVAGLVFAVGAAHLGWRGQRAYQIAERYRREALELLWVFEPTPDPRAVVAITTELGFDAYLTSHPDQSAPWFRSQKQSRDSVCVAKHFQLAFMVVVSLSTVAFLIGTAVGTATV